MAQKKPGRNPGSTSLVFFDGFPSLVAGNVCINGKLPLARKSSFLLDKLLELFDQPWVRFSSGRCGCFFGLSVGHVNHIARLGRLVADCLVGRLSTTGCDGRLVLPPSLLRRRLILVGCLGLGLFLSGCLVGGWFIGERPTK